MRIRRGWRAGFAAFAALALAQGAAAQSRPPGQIDGFAGKPRVLVLSDIGNEPDDQMSFVRLLMYSNQLELEGLVATTSTWQRSKVQPETLHELIAAYGEVRPNLLDHADRWPEAAAVRAPAAARPRRCGVAR